MRYVLSTRHLQCLSHTHTRGEGRKKEKGVDDQKTTKNMSQVDS